MNRNLSVYLDLVRLGAAVGVLLSHAKRFIEPELPKILSSHGPECVALFFVLSGFVIRYATSKSDAGITSYALARSSRMWSVAVPAILVTILADKLGIFYNYNYYLGLEFWDGPTSLMEITRSLLFLNESWGARITMGTNDPYWSLGYEVAYYIAYATYFVRSKSVRWLCLILWCFVFGPQIAAYGALWAIGVAAYDLSKRLAQGDRRMNRSVAYLMIASPVLYPILKYAIFPPLGSPMRFDSLDQWALSYIYYLAIAVLIAAHFLGCSILFRSRSILTQRAERSIVWAAGATFTIYLMHQPIIVAMGAINEIHPSPWLSGPGGLAFAVTCLFVLAEFGERRKRQVHFALDRIVTMLAAKPTWRKL